MGLDLADLQFDRPVDLVAREPAERRGLARDEVRLLVSRVDGQRSAHEHATVVDLPSFLEPADLLVVNQSATIPAALGATGPDGPFLLHLCTDYGDGRWLVEPRVSPSEPGPLALDAGDTITVGDLRGRVVGPYPGIDRLVFVRFDGDVRAVADEAGRPIRYGYVDQPFPLSDYQTIFAAEPGSAEMPSAGRPFTERVVDRLRARGVGVVSITLHTGVSSLEVERDQCGLHCEERACNPLYPEPFAVRPATAAAVNRTRARGGRIVAVGTTVVRALESAWDPGVGRVRASGGFTRRFVTPDTGVSVVDGLFTGLHDPETTHLAMLYAIGGRDLVMDGYARAIDEGYRWHEFGDVHLLLPAVERTATAGG